NQPCCAAGIPNPCAPDKKAPAAFDSSNRTKRSPGLSAAEAFGSYRRILKKLWCRAKRQVASKHFFETVFQKWRPHFAKRGGPAQNHAAYLSREERRRQARLRIARPCQVDPCFPNGAWPGCAIAMVQAPEGPAVLM